jgi:Arc/MetJ family transcription regulator
MARTVVNLDEKLLRRALRLTGLKKKVHVVNLALSVLVRQREQLGIRSLRGKLRSWEGDLGKRRGRR